MITAQVLKTAPAELLKKLDTLFKDNSWYAWEPEVVLTMLKDVISDEAKDKVLAVQSVACDLTPAMSSALAFENVVHAFCNNIIIPDILQAASIEEIMYSVHQLNEIAQHLHGKPAYFYNEVPQYIAAAAKYAGWLVLPPRLEFAQECLNNISGFVPGSKKYTDFSAIVELIRNLYSQIDTDNLESYPEIIELINEDSVVANITKKVLGAYLFDPTKDVS